MKEPLKDSVVPKLQGGDDLIEKIYFLSNLMNRDLPLHEKLSQPSNKEIGYFIKVNLDNSEYEGLKAFKPKALGRKILYVEQRGNFTVSKSPSINFSEGRKQEKDDEKKIKKIREIIEKVMNFFDHSSTRKIYHVISENFETIFEDLMFKDRKNAILSVLVVKNGKELYPSECDDIVKVFISKNLDHGKKERYNRCFLCGRGVISYPQLNDVFKFATFDKPGFTPNISKKSSNVLSICDDCKATLKAGRTFIEEKLSFSFFGDTLWIVPYAPNRLLLERLMDSLQDIYSSQELRKFSVSERQIEKRLSEGEDLSYDFLVLSISNSEEKILLHISDVPPSRLSFIYSESEKMRKDLGESYDPNFSNLWKIFRTPKTQKSGKKDFYALVRAIYKEGSAYSKEVFLSYVMRWARSEIINADSNKFLGNLIYTGTMLFSAYLYLVRLKIMEGGDGMESESFFGRYPEFFDSEWKKAVFLTGVLTGYLIEHQMKERNSAPFVKKLKGLKMRKEDVQSLLSEIKAKVFQYKIGNERVESTLERASNHFINAGNWSANVDEINFVFTVGMSMHRRFIRGDEHEEE